MSDEPVSEEFRQASRRLMERNGGALERLARVEAQERAETAERECDQLRAEVERLRGNCDSPAHRAWFAHLEEATAEGPPEGSVDDMPELVRRLAHDRPELFYPLADATLRAERDQALTLLRAVRSHFDEHFIRDRWLREVRTMLDRSGLLDDKGQQR